MRNFHAYHRVKDRGPFGGTIFYTSKTVNAGDILYVVLGRTTGEGGRTEYYLDGKFGVLSVDANPPGSQWEWKLLLDPLVRSEQPINFSGGSGFDTDGYRNYFISTGGFKEIKAEKHNLVELFDRLLAGFRSKK